MGHFIFKKFIMPGTEQSRPVECCCQDRIPDNDVEPNNSDPNLKLRFDQSILSHQQSEYMKDSIVTTNDTTNSNNEMSKFESNVIMISGDENNREKEKQNQVQILETMELEDEPSIEKEKVNELQEDEKYEKSMLTEDIEYFSIIEKYKNLIKEANLLENLEEKIKEITKPIEQGVELTKVTYDKERDLQFKVTIKEHILETVRHHELVQEYTIKDIAPE